MQPYSASRETVSRFEPVTLGLQGSNLTIAPIYLAFNSVIVNSLVEEKI